MGLILSILIGLVPMLIYSGFLYWLDRFEKEPKALLAAVFLWGAIGAAGLAFMLNSAAGTSIYMMTGSANTTQTTTGSIIAPFVEESLKGFGVLVIALFFRKQFDSMMDGVVYAGIAALGFAATENIYYIYNYGFVHRGLSGLLYLAFVRVIVVGWQHPFFTSFTGIGLAVSRLSRNLPIRVLAPIAGWLAAVLTHSIHNTLADVVATPKQDILSSLVDWVGWLLMFAFVLYSLRREQSWVKHELADEVSLGIITPAQYNIASSSWGQVKARWKALQLGKFRETNRFYQLCGVLAHKKRLRSKLGEETGNTVQISNIRTELVALSPCVITQEELILPG